MRLRLRVGPLLQRRPAALFALALVVVLASSCGGGGSGEASVSIASPEDGATVESPFEVAMEAQNFTIEPAGGVRDGAGHFHLAVDADCVPAGQMIPEDEAHRHLVDGASELELSLPPGEHTLCAQAGDGTHTALDLTHEITITVAGQVGAVEEEVWEGTMIHDVTTVPASAAGPCGVTTRLNGTVRIVVEPDGIARGTYDVEGCLVSEPHAEFTGRATDEAFHFPELIVQTNGEPIPKVSETEARATLTNFQGDPGVAGARWVTTWRLRCTNC